MNLKGLIKMNNFMEHIIKKEQYEYHCDLINGMIYIFTIPLVITNGIHYEYKADEQHKDKFNEFNNI